MSTYRNCYTILKEVRMGLNEYSTALLQATSTSGKYDNDWLVEQINAAQRYIYNIILKRRPELFLTSLDVTVTSSVITKPWDCGLMVRLVDDDGLQVYRSKVGVLPVFDQEGSDRLYYEAANNQLILNKSGVNATYKLYYYIKPRDITQGKAPEAGKLATTAKLLADYYNNMILEDITSAWVDTITDYTAARAVTITETLGANDYYGVVSELPEPFHEFIAPLAVIFAKSIHPKSQEKPSSTEVSTISERIEAAMNVYAGADPDVSPEEIWTDYEPGDLGVGGVQIPGLNYLIG